MIKIKKGLIFAAGKGTRLRPLTLSTPKPLLKVKGTPMIETIIGSMIANGVETIYIVLGYQKEKFYYLKDKYSEIIFLENNDFETRNTISSLYTAKDILNDHFIISEGDLFVQDREIFKTDIEKSQYLYRPNQLQNDEWGFHIDFLTNNILEVRRPEESVYLNNNLYGVSFWKKDDLKQVVDEVIKEYNNPKYKEAAYDELINNIINNLEITVREVNENQIVEIDSLDELFAVDASYSFFKSIDLLKSLLGITREDITNIYDNPGRSLNNYNYVLETAKNKYIIRIPGMGTELFCSRKDELLAYQELKGQDLAEENYFLDHISGIKVSKYYEDSRIINSESKEDLEKLMVKLRKLHSGDFKFKPDNVFNRIRRYDSFVAIVHGRKFYSDEFKELQKEMLENEKFFLSIFENKPIHGDLSPNNAIVTKEGEVVLIDLEFVSMGDPYTDIATFSHDGNYTPEQTIDLLEIYLQRKPNNDEIFKLLTICSLVSIMWYSWSVFKMAVEEQDRLKFQEYRDIYYDYAVVMKDASKKYQK